MTDNMSDCIMEGTESWVKVEEEEEDMEVVGDTRKVNVIEQKVGVDVVDKVEEGIQEEKVDEEKVQNEVERKEDREMGEMKEEGDRMVKEAEEKSVAEDSLVTERNMEVEEEDQDTQTEDHNLDMSNEMNTKVERPIQEQKQEQENEIEEMENKLAKDTKDTREGIYDVITETVNEEEKEEDSNKIQTREDKQTGGETLMKVTTAEVKGKEEEEEKTRVMEDTAQEEKEEKREEGALEEGAMEEEEKGEEKDEEEQGVLEEKTMGEEEENVVMKEEDAEVLEEISGEEEVEKVKENEQGDSIMADKQVDNHEDQQEKLMEGETLRIEDEDVIEKVENGEEQVVVKELEQTVEDMKKEEGREQEAVDERREKGQDVEVEKEQKEIMEAKREKNQGANDEDEPIMVDQDIEPSDGKRDNINQQEMVKEGVAQMVEEGVAQMVEEGVEEEANKLETMEEKAESIQKKEVHVEEMAGNTEEEKKLKLVNKDGETDEKDLKLVQKKGETDEKYLDILNEERGTDERDLEVVQRQGETDEKDLRNKERERWTDERDIELISEEGETEEEKDLELVNIEGKAAEEKDLDVLNEERKTDERDIKLVSDEGETAEVKYLELVNIEGKAAEEKLERKEGETGEEKDLDLSNEERGTDGKGIELVSEEGETEEEKYLKPARKDEEDVEQNVVEQNENKYSEVKEKQAGINNATNEDMVAKTKAQDTREEEEGELSEGELEDGEVLSSEEEEEEEDEQQLKVHENKASVTEEEPPGPVRGSKRPAQDSSTEAPNPKVSRMEPSSSSDTQGAGPDGSDAEEGEIFSDDEEAAYFPQKIRSRETGGEKKTGRSSGSQDHSPSPERERSRQRRRHSRERGGGGRDGEPKSLATLFFEDRDGTPSEQSDDGKEGRNRRRGDGVRHSSSPSSRSSRDRGERRERRTGRTEEKGHNRSKDSHHHHNRSRSVRERDWDQDDSSEDDSSSSTWSQRGRRGYGSTTYSQRARRGGTGSGNSYQAKFGPKHDRPGGGSGRGGESRGGGTGRGGGGRDWNQRSSQDTVTQVDVKKRREKGLSLLLTPKMKPSDNLDEFNYPAPPSWYLEAVEKWEAEKGSTVIESEGENVVKPLNTVASNANTVTTTTVSETPPPQPLFPIPPPPPTFVPQPQQQQQQQPMPPMNVTPSILGEPPHQPSPKPLMQQLPVMGVPPPGPPLAGVPPPPHAPHLPHVAPPPQGQIPSLFPKVLPPPTSIPLPSLTVPAPGVPLRPPTMQPQLNPLHSSFPSDNPTLLHPQLPRAGSQVAIGEEKSLQQVAGRDTVGQEGGTKVVSTVRVSSLALNITSSHPGEVGGGRREEDDEEEEDEEGRMKIALETPTPQPASTSEPPKTFSFVHNEPTVTEPQKSDSTSETPSLPEGAQNNKDTLSERESVITEEKMEVDISVTKDPAKMQFMSSNASATESFESPPTISHSSVISLTSTLTVTSTTISTTTTATAAAHDKNFPHIPLKTFSPPPKSLPPSSVSQKNMFGTGIKDEEEEEEEEGAIPDRDGEESEMEEGDSDYDKYLDQLDEEEEEGEERVGGEEVAGSALIGAISASLLHNNPLDEDFPTINPTNSLPPAEDKEQTLKSLLGDVIDVPNRSKRRGGSKSVRRKQKESDWWEKQNKRANSRSKSPAVKPPCKFYISGFCKQGENCQFSHDVPRPKKKEMCRFYLQDMCTKGDECRYYHGEFPCKFFHTMTGCKNGDSCKFSHAPLTEETSQLLTQVLEPARTPTQWTEPPLPSALAPSSSTTISSANITHDPRVLAANTTGPGPISGGNIRYFTSGADNGSLTPNYLTSPLLVSIPKQALELSLPISIPRQKLGPPFGTVRIPSSSVSAPTNQTQTTPPQSLPHESNSQSQPVAPPPPQLSNAQLLPPPTLPPPHQPVNPSNVPLAGMPPRGGPPPGVWQGAGGGAPDIPAKPVPLFPPPPQPEAPQQIAPTIPPSHLPHPPHPPPQQMAHRLPPPSVSSERKCLLPTPPSHMRLDPKNILWSEDDKPEYWEAPNTTAGVQFGHQQSSSDSVGPTLHHTEPASGPNQQGLRPPASDPRQSRPQPGVNLDPRSGGAVNLNSAVSIVDTARHQVVGGPNYRPPPPPHQTSSLPPPQGHQGPRPQQWPHPPSTNLNPMQSKPHFPTPPGPQPPFISPSSNPGTIIPPGQKSTPLNAPPMSDSHGIRPSQQHRPSPSHQQHHHSSPQTSWDPPPPTTYPPLLGPDKSTGSSTDRVGVEMRPAARVDPRTKYSHLKIKSKTSQSPSTSREGEGGGGGVDRTHMPKLLQEPPPTLQRPFDPQELFENPSSREVDESPYPTGGHFGSSFGSFFNRSSPSKNTNNSPYGEITMDSSKTSDKTETVTERGTLKNKAMLEKVLSLDKKNESHTEGGGGVVTTAKSSAASVPSYLAELGMGSDLTIDSAFSSLGGEGKGTGEKDNESQKAEVMAKKLPNIFGLGSGTSL